MRTLASIQLVNSVEPIPDADNIECITIGGWKVVSNKGQFSPGDLCVYFEIDSVLPQLPVFEFLRKSSYIKNDIFDGFRLKTIKLRGQISQGLALRIDQVMPDTVYMDSDIGLDLTEFFNILKWEPNIPSTLTGTIAGRYPESIPKTDQERVQNLSRELEIWSSVSHFWEVTEKMEGQSLTVYYNNGHVGVCSRNWELKEETDYSTWKLVNDLGLKESLVDHGTNIAIQGELIGPSVQGNHYKIPKLEFLVYDIFDIDNKTFLTSFDRKILCDLLNIKHVPIINLTFNTFGTTMESLISIADGDSLFNPIVSREGLVYKNLLDPNISFKTVSNAYLLKKNH